MTRSSAPRGWRNRESYAHDRDNYQMQCGHYQSKGLYVCEDCNLAPLSDWLELREALSEAVECLESYGGSTLSSPALRARLDRERAAITRARAILNEVD